MEFIVSKKQPTLSEEGTVMEVVVEEREETETPNTVTRHLYLKPAHTSETLDKDQLLRRIRHRKRVNKFRNALLALLRSPFSSSSGVPDKVPVHHESWLDDAFSAP
ncbi:hypothetical protein NE237_018168 [Protea cynaroides]|uniref:Uncharacterized protein n=1 Tax=Protea cynaroides TaxID=273540 RepID=A0A9Q0K9D9_9MAGN|nr:hypothetical protein NE237_018168 [Protea cynaroides]